MVASIFRPRASGMQNAPEYEKGDGKTGKQKYSLFYF